MAQLGFARDGSHIASEPLSEDPMTLDDYAAWAATVRSRATGAGRDRLLAYLAIGLAAEAGEVAGEIKTLLRDGALDRAETLEELGNVIYYWARLCRALGVAPSKVLAASQARIVAKIKETPKARVASKRRPKSRARPASRRR
ncbi:MAG: hypothetical protein SFV21_07720 [Rhodospirillaceae bacterium]|nr:hypothetical protein [Rhodospirillaceae bacterium]